MCPNFDAIVIENSSETLGCLSQKAFLGGFEMPWVGLGHIAGNSTRGEKLRPQFLVLMVTLDSV